MALHGRRRTRGPRRVRLHRGGGPLTGPLGALLEYGASWLHFVALVLGGGALVGQWAFARHLDPTEREPVLDLASRMAQACALLLLVAFAAAFARQVVEFRDPFVPLGEDVELLLRTDWGTAWKWGIAGAVLALAGFLAPGFGISAWILGATGLLVTAAYPAFTGHAASGDPAALSITLDVVHVVAASAWIGGLGILVAALRRAPRHAPRLVAAFSPLAMAAVGALLLTGVAANLRMLGSPVHLVTTPWGRVLAVKLVLVAAVLALGARNWRVLTPGLGSEEGDRAMLRSATLELVLGQVVLLATAVLVRTSPG